jgi:glycosyltransferase involved in cell wall biosynthesis
MIKISVIMSSFLGDYPGCAKNRDKKFIRAVKTFKNQTYPNKELIIVADGCDKTYEIYEKNWKDDENIDCIFIPKQVLYSGQVRTEGLKHTTGDIITYLDNDDALGKKHLEVIEKQFTDDIDWCYYDDYLVLSKDFKQLQKRIVEPRFGSIGTSSISHRNLPELKEQGIFSDGYGHDWIAVLSLASKGLKFKKLKENPSYLVCHWGGGTSSGDF